MEGTDGGAERGDDSDTRSNSVWRACGHVYGQLARDSGLPGADVLVEGGRFRRLLWTGALLTLVYYSASETGAILREYFTYSVAVAFEYNTNESFELPDVTVCNVNPLRRSKLCALEASERAMDPELEERLCGKGQKFKERKVTADRRRDTARASSRRIRFLSKSLKCSTYSDAHVDLCSTQANPDDIKLQHRLSDWMAQRAVRDEKQLEAVGHQFTDVIIDCTYHEKDCKHARFFLNHTNPWYGNCFCIHCEKTDRLFEYNSLASPFDGLVMTLNPELHEYLPTSYQAGFLVMIHAHGTRYRRTVTASLEIIHLPRGCFHLLGVWLAHKFDEPSDSNEVLNLDCDYTLSLCFCLSFYLRRHSVCSDGVYLTPGYTTYVGLSVLAQTGLPAPYANPCRRTWPKCLLQLLEEPYGEYTREVKQDCLNLCLQHIVVERCGCLTAQLPQLHKLARKYGACGEHGKATRCTSSNCEARSVCTYTGFALPVISCRCSLCRPPARLVLYFDSLTYEHIRSVPKYDETRVLSNLGGISGMYLGLSFFVLFQVLDILVVGALRLRRMLHWDARQRLLVELARPHSRGDSRATSHN
nr:amiloride-sensitive sodium channel subunit gamma-like [Dermacentor andersoni]